MRLFTILALAVAIGLASAASPFASSDPDGLEKVAAEHAFQNTGKGQGGPIAGYAFPGVKDERLATGLAGFTGTLIVFALGYGVARTARRRPAAA
jgi:PDGLE domain